VSVDDADLAARNHADANDRRAEAAERPRARKSADEFANARVMVISANVATVFAFAGCARLSRCVFQAIHRCYPRRL